MSVCTPETISCPARVHARSTGGAATTSGSGARRSNGGGGPASNSSSSPFEGGTEPASNGSAPTSSTASAAGSCGSDGAISGSSDSFIVVAEVTWGVTGETGPGSCGRTRGNQAFVSLHATPEYQRSPAA